MLVIAFIDIIISPFLGIYWRLSAPSNWRYAIVSSAWLKSLFISLYALTLFSSCHTPFLVIIIIIMPLQFMPTSAAGAQSNRTRDTKSLNMLLFIEHAKRVSVAMRMIYQADIYWRHITHIILRRAVSSFHLSLSISWMTAGICFPLDREASRLSPQMQLTIRRHGHHKKWVPFPRYSKLTHRPRYRWI
jgi:hypothetical protein